MLLDVMPSLKPNEVIFTIKFFSAFLIFLVIFIWLHSFEVVSLTFRGKNSVAEKNIDKANLTIN